MVIIELNEWVLLSGFSIGSFSQPSSENEGQSEGENDGTQLPEGHCSLHYITIVTVADIVLALEIMMFVSKFLQLWPLWELPWGSAKWGPCFTCQHKV